jgi:hypothetical protein
VGSSERQAKAADHAFIAIAALGLFGYSVLRAVRVPLTIDEAETYISYLSGNIQNVFSFNAANNHFLNTLLARVFTALFGDGELILRLPGLIGLVLYLVFGFLLLRRFASRPAAFLGFFLLNLNAYLLDFFSLSRGYGLALGCMMASFYFFAGFLSGIAGGEKAPERKLRGSLAAGGGAVMSSFVMLDVYLALVCLAFAAFVLSKPKCANAFGHEDGARTASFARKRSFLTWLVLIFIFNALVAFQESKRSRGLYAPVSVRIDSVEAGPLPGVSIIGSSTVREGMNFAYDHGSWSLERGRFLTGISIRVPAAARAGVRGIEILIGSKVFRLRRDDLNGFSPPGQDLRFETPADVSLARSRMRDVDQAINWRGDARYLRHVLVRILFLAAVAAAAVAAVLVIRRSAALRRFATPAQWMSVTGPALVLAGFAAYPLFILNRRHELFWGGWKGLIPDTWTSLVDGSFYGTLYSPRQNGIAGAVWLLIAALGIAAAAVHARKKRGRPFVSGAVFPALIGLAALSVLARRIIFGQPYPIGRTALVFIPLATLAAIFALDSFGRLGGAAKAAGIAVLALLALFAGFHFSRTANARMTDEWREDCDTKRLVSDLPAIKAQFAPSASVLRLGVEWSLVPSLAYHLRRERPSWLDAVSTDLRAENDLYYIHETFDPSRMVLVKDYPDSGNILVRPRDGIR